MKELIKSYKKLQSFSKFLKGKLKKKDQIIADNSINIYEGIINDLERMDEIMSDAEIHKMADAASFMNPTRDKPIYYKGLSDGMKFLRNLLQSMERETKPIMDESIHDRFDESQ